MLKFRSKSGQALVEMLPSLVIFLVVMSAGLAYFRIMRNATIRQEVVRNLAFAKINNTGTMTTSLSQAVGEVQFLDGQPVLQGDRNDDVYDVPGGAYVKADCFTVSPREATVSAEVPPGAVYSLGELNPVDITTYAVVYRNVSGQSCP